VRSSFLNIDASVSEDEPSPAPRRRCSRCGRLRPCSSAWSLSS